MQISAWKLQQAESSVTFWQPFHINEAVPFQYFGGKFIQMAYLYSPPNHIEFYISISFKKFKRRWIHQQVFNESWLRNQEFI